MITETSQIRLRRPVVEVLIFGQSVEQGAGPTSDQAAHPTAFKSALKAGVAVPFGPSISRGGAWWPGVYDDLYAYGYDLRFVNAAIGSMSFLRDATNWLQGRNNNRTQYNQYRAPPGVPGDRGDWATSSWSANAYFSVSSDGAGMPLTRASFFRQTTSHFRTTLPIRRQSSPRHPLSLQA